MIISLLSSLLNATMLGSKRGGYEIVDGLNSAVFCTGARQIGTGLLRLAEQNFGAGPPGAATATNFSMPSGNTG